MAFSKGWLVYGPDWLPVNVNKQANISCGHRNASAAKNCFRHMTVLHDFGFWRVEGQCTVASSVLNYHSTGPKELP